MDKVSASRVISSYKGLEYDHLVVPKRRSVLLDTLSSSKGHRTVAVIHLLHLPFGPSCNAEKQ